MEYSRNHTSPINPRANPYILLILYVLLQSLFKQPTLRYPRHTMGVPST